MPEAEIDATVTPDATPKFGSIVPEAYRDKPYLKDLMELEVGDAAYGELFKKFDGAQSLIGKKAAPLAADASAEDYDKFYASSRPETLEGYEVGDNVQPEFAKVLREGYNKMGATPRQAKIFEDTVLGPILEKEAAATAEATALDEAFTKITTDAFGEDNAKVLARAQAVLKDLTPEALQPFVGKLPNESLAVLSGVVNAILDKYGVEDDFTTDNSSSGGGDDPAAMRLAGEKLMASEAWSDPMHADNAKVVAEVNDLFKQADTKDRATRKA